MKILNLYAGIGGNRKFWSEEYEITAVEYNQEIADIYKDYFPEDKVVVGDAHDYLLGYYKEYDFVWASPPCPTHSAIRQCGVYRGQYKAKYPDMKLYEEIILLQNFADLKTKWVIENVKPYYDYLIEPSAILGRHPIWCNFKLEEKEIKTKEKIQFITGKNKVYGFDISSYKLKQRKDKILRNLVNPEIGLYILNQAMGIPGKEEPSLFD